MTDYIRAQEWWEKNPDHVIKKVLDRISPRKIEKIDISPKTRSKFRKGVRNCIGTRGVPGIGKAARPRRGYGASLQEKMMDECITKEIIKVAKREGLLRRSNFKKRLEDIGWDDLIKETGEAMREGIRDIKREEGKELLKGGWKKK